MKSFLIITLIFLSFSGSAEDWIPDGMLVDNSGNVTHTVPLPDDFTGPKSTLTTLAYIAEIEFWSLSNYDNDVRERIKLLYVKLLKLFKGIVRKGIDDKLYKNLNVDVAALSIMTSLQGVIWFSIFEESTISAEQYLNDVIEFIIFGFKK